MWTFRNLKGASRAAAKGKGLHPAEATPDRAKFVQIAAKIPLNSPISLN